MQICPPFAFEAKALNHKTARNDYAQIEQASLAASRLTLYGNSGRSGSLASTLLGRSGTHGFCGGGWRAGSPSRGPSGRGIADGQRGDAAADLKIVEQHQPLIDSKGSAHLWRCGAAAHRSLGRKLHAHIAAAQGAQMVNSYIEIKLATVQSALTGNTRCSPKAIGGGKVHTGKPQGSCPAFFKIKPQIYGREQHAQGKIFVPGIVHAHKAPGGWRF